MATIVFPDIMMSHLRRLLRDVSAGIVHIVRGQNMERNNLIYLYIVANTQIIHVN